ncbi:MAG: endolytic transglycosylase MltG [Lawsonibacter sp.]|nr:endolytic transglycosylase MltG [Lawsonibacter sp.]
MSQDYYERERRSGNGRSPGRREHEESGESRPQSRRPRKKRRSAGRTAGLVLLYVTAVIGVSILLACVGWVCAEDVLALNKQPHKEITFTITADEDFDSVADRLKKEGMIEYKSLFKLFATITHKKDSLSVGTYTLDTDMDYRALLAGMRANSANRAQVRVSIPEGYTVDQIFSLLVEKGVAADIEELQDAAANHDYSFDFLQNVVPLGDYHRLEGYLMPATYDFYTPHDPIYALNKLLVYFDSEVITDSIMEQVEESGYTLREVLTIASMIERETTGEDREDISAVIHNRLENPSAGTQGYLQIDATLVYINGGREPVESDRNIDSPYNTYLYKGLPPGPIANPGMESIVAALKPSDSKDFYYALGDDNTHHFFRTYDQLQSFIASQERYNSN